MNRSLRYTVSVAVLLAGCSGGGADDPTMQATGVLEVPQTVDLGTVALGATASGNLAVRNAGTADLVVEAVELPAPFTGGAALPATIVPGATLSVPVAFAPVESGPVAGRLRVTAAGEVREVSLTAAGGPSPLHCTPTAVALGRPLIGTSRPFVIACAVDADRAIDSVDVAYDGPAEVSRNGTGPVELPAGAGTVQFDFAYAPTEVTPLDATVRIVSGAVLLAEVPVAATPIATAVSLLGAGDLSCPGGPDLGYTPPGTTLSGRAFFLENAGDEPIEVSGVAVEGPFAVAPAGPFTLPADDPATTANEGVLAFETTFAPVAPGPAAGRLTVTFADPVHAPAIACFSAFGGGPALSCAPTSVDFGPVAAGLPRTETVTCANVGTLVPGVNDSRLHLDSADGEGPGFSVAANLPVSGLAPGESVALAVTFAPAAAGEVTGAVAIASNDRAAPLFRVPVAGEGLVLPSCAVRIEPETLDFGPVAAGGTPATLPVSIHNDGTDGCLVRDLDLAPTSAAAFSLPDGPVAAAVIEPGAALVVPVRFVPASPAPTAGTLVFGLSSPAAPVRSVPLAGAAAPVAPCLGIFPESVDFGDVAPGCASLTAELALVNDCELPVPVGDLSWLGSAGPFRLSAPSPVDTIPPGGVVTVRVEYRPTAAGEHFAGLRRTTATDATGRLVPIRGRAAMPAGVETFPPLPTQVDVLWVMDNSGGIFEEQHNASTALPSFLGIADAWGLDWQFGVTTTGLAPAGPSCPGGASGGEDGRLFPVDGSSRRIVRSTMADGVAQAASRLFVGDCHYDEAGLEAAHRALTAPAIDHANDPRHPEPNDGNLGLLRPGARLVVIELTDEIDQSPSTSAFYAAAMAGATRAAWREPRFSAHAITGDRGTGCSRAGTGAAEQGDKLIAWSDATGGHFVSVCSADWAGDFNDLGLAAFGRTRLLLKGRPTGTISPSSTDLQLRVDGAPWTGAWTWDAVANAVVFAPGDAPDPDATVEVRYVPACVSPAP